MMGNEVRDLERKAKYYNDVKAQLELGKVYRDGKDVEANLNLALDWFQKAARQGNKEAQSCLEAIDGGSIPENSGAGTASGNPALFEGDSSPLIQEQPTPVTEISSTGKEADLSQDHAELKIGSSNVGFGQPKGVDLDDDKISGLQPSSRSKSALKGESASRSHPLEFTSSPSEGVREKEKPVKRKIRKRRKEKSTTKDRGRDTATYWSITGTRWSVGGIVMMAMIWVFWNWVNDGLRERVAGTLSIDVNGVLTVHEYVPTLGDVISELRTVDIPGRGIVQDSALGRALVDLRTRSTEKQMGAIEMLGRIFSDAPTSGNGLLVVLLKNEMGMNDAGSNKMAKTIGGMFKNIRKGGFNVEIEGAKISYEMPDSAINTGEEFIDSDEEVIDAAVNERLKLVYHAESLVYTLALLAGVMGFVNGLKGQGKLYLGVAALGWWSYDYYRWYASEGVYWWWWAG